MTGRLAGRTVIVTGASKGIGRAAATALCREGASLILTARNAAPFDGLLEELAGIAQADVKGSGHAQHTECCEHDVSSEESWAKVMSIVSDDLGGLYGVVNNAGAFILKPLAATTEAEFDQLYRTNVEGTWLGIKHGFAAIQRSGRPGAIVNVSSLMGQVGVADGVAYCATKGAVTGMTKAAAIDGAAMTPRIRVNSLHPGVIWTPMLTSIFGEDEAGGAMFAADTPLRRLGRPEDIAEAIVFLLSDDSSYMTGAELTVDGGRGAD